MEAATGAGTGGSKPPPSWKHNNVPCPFSVEPFSGDIEAGGEQVFTVRFAPQEVRTFWVSASSSANTEVDECLELGLANFVVALIYYLPLYYWYLYTSCLLVLVYNLQREMDRLGFACFAMNVICLQHKT